MHTNNLLLPISSYVPVISVTSYCMYVPYPIIYLQCDAVVWWFGVLLWMDIGIALRCASPVLSSLFCVCIFRLHRIICGTVLRAWERSGWSIGGKNVSHHYARHHYIEAWIFLANMQSKWPTEVAMSIMVCVSHHMMEDLACY
jgi:hypothetical protein